MGLRDVTLNQFSFPFLGQMWCCRTAGLEGTVCSMQDLSRAMRLGWVGFGGLICFLSFFFFFFLVTYLPKLLSCRTGSGSGSGPTGLSVFSVQGDTGMVTIETANSLTRYLR